MIWIIASVVSAAANATTSVSVAMELLEMNDQLNGICERRLAKWTNLLTF